MTTSLFSGADGFHNTKADAFRHAFFNAINSRDTRDFVARAFSVAHESEVPDHLDLERQMDLFNNNVGHLIGQPLWFESNAYVSEIVMNRLNNGELLYLSPLEAVVPPNFGINANTQLTPTNQ